MFAVYSDTLPSLRTLSHCSICAYLYNSSDVDHYFRSTVTPVRKIILIFTKVRVIQPELSQLKPKLLWLMC